MTEREPKAEQPAETQTDEIAAAEGEEQEQPPHEVNFAEYYHEARPRTLRHRARVRSTVRRRSVSQDGPASGENPVYVSWLLAQSMLGHADELARQFSGQGSMWQNPFANPGPRHAVETASVWFTAYPISLITEEGTSFLGALGDEAMWEAFEAIGIEALHTGPVKKAGGISGWQPTPSVDGHFDRISNEIDPAFGTEDEFRAMCAAATWHGGTIIDDIVPGHTGKGADFRLAELGYGDYPGIYHMVEIEPGDWNLLPDVPPGHDSVNLDQATEEALEKTGYIVGRLQRVIFFQEGVKETNWSATCEVTGVDGVARRWVYLHYFKDGQPSVNWLDPTFAGMRMVIGDALHSLADLGSGALRLDANGFLGVEKSTGGMPGWSEGHPLSEAANHLIASMVRKVGGFTFQELNLTVDDIRSASEAGADLSYDFINRPAYHHALATADTEFLRLTLRTALDVGVDPASLVHALQNHDELTYELVHWTAGHPDELYAFRGEEMRGGDLADTIRKDLSEALTGADAPYNLVFTTNGIACTTATVIAASLGIGALDDIGPDDVARIRRVHLLLVMFNAFQPGVFALSGWDLLGMLTLPPDRVPDLLASGDTRWISRPAHDLMGHSPDADRSSSGMPRGRSLYGSLPEQLTDDESFVRQMQAILAVRKDCGVATAEQIDIPDVSHRGLLVMVHRLQEAGPDGRFVPGKVQVTVLNFADEDVDAFVRSEHLDPGSTVVDLFSGEEIGTVDELNGFRVPMSPFRAMAVLLEPPADEE
ncbi:maltose alpha-D-glucosyltransferase [Pseudonocardia phyllosphaerae]|uniref:maltose alpha-D-glucosyltransferase n=1 Tax=Pseudonocardia phyllosphaerae TaxID=3390502 RepID=UPI00397C17AB